MPEIRYNVWNVKANRWVNSGSTRTGVCGPPKRLTLEEANLVLKNHLIFGSYEVRVIRPDDSSFPIPTQSIKPTSTPVQPSVAINDHTCRTCRNDRVSRSEKTCWRCGHTL